MSIIYLQIIEEWANAKNPTSTKIAFINSHATQKIKGLLGVPFVYVKFNNMYEYILFDFCCPAFNKW